MDPLGSSFGLILLEHTAKVVAHQPGRPLALLGSLQAPGRTEGKAGMSFGGRFDPTSGISEEIRSTHDDSPSR